MRTRPIDCAAVRPGAPRTRPCRLAVQRLFGAGALAAFAYGLALRIAPGPKAAPQARRRCLEAPAKPAAPSPRGRGRDRSTPRRSRPARLEARRAATQPR